jgi:hypothetical protein
MFVVKQISTNKLYVWGNEKKDDFIRFLPNNLGVPMNDLQVYLVPCESHQECDAYNRPLYAEEVNGEIIVKSYDSVTVDEQAEQLVFGNVMNQFTATLIQWPYDENMNFLGNGHELEQGE